jgi:SAM-dependent methyltransferase
MDLRRYNLSVDQIERAIKVLNYQPFIISNDIQTGIAYSWVCSGNPLATPQLIFRKSDCAWDDAAAENQRLRVLYDGFIEQIAERFPGGSLFDVACNNGYFPVRAEMMGMRGCVASDLGRHYKYSIRFLNAVIGTGVKFIHAPYHPKFRSIMTLRKFDVVVASAILCHIASPLDFLAAISRVARHAVFFWGHMDTSSEMAVFFNRPYAGFASGRFPNAFNEGTRISRPLFDFAMQSLGFREIVQLQEPDGALKLGGHVGMLAIR